MIKRIIAISMICILMLSISGCKKGKDDTQDKNIKNTEQGSIIVGDMEIAYDKNINNISYSNWASSGNETTIIYNSQVYDIKAEHRNDENIEFPCIYIDYKETDRPDIEQIKNDYIAFGRENIKEEEKGDFIIINSTKKLFTNTQDISYVYYNIIPKTKGFIYEITCPKGTEILRDSEKSYTYTYSLDETAFNSISQAVDKYTNSTNSIGSFSGTKQMLDSINGSLSDYKGDSTFKASTREGEMQIIGKNGEVRTKEAEKLENSDLPDITPEEEIIKQETLDITEVEETDSIQSDISYTLTPEDLIQREKEYYTVGEDIDPGIYQIINNNKVRYNNNGDVVPESVIGGYLKVYQPDISEEDPLEDQIVVDYEINNEDPEGWLNTQELTLFSGQKIYIENLNITLQYKREFESEYTGDYGKAEALGEGQ